MEQPSKFIANSDFASTPSSLAGAYEFEITSPTNIQLTEGVPKEYTYSHVFDADFGAFISYMRIDGGDLIQISQPISIIEYNDAQTYDYYIFAKAEMRSAREVVFKIVYSSFFNLTTSSTPHTFKATIIPIKTPYQA